MTLVLSGRRMFVSASFYISSWFKSWSKFQNSPNRFYPTRLAASLTSSAPLLADGSSDGTGPSQGFIILETNYRLYAYTGEHHKVHPESFMKVTELYLQITHCRLQFLISLWTFELASRIWWLVLLHGRVWNGLSRMALPPNKLVQKCLLLNRFSPVDATRRSLATSWHTPTPRCTKMLVFEVLCHFLN